MSEESVDKNLEATPPAERDFRVFLAENADSMKSDPERKQAMRVGDYIEMPKAHFDTWSEVLGDQSTRAETRERVEETLDQPKSTEDDSRIVRVRIVKIHEGGEYPRLRMLVEVDGVQKEIFSSLFYNNFTTHANPDYQYDSSSAGFSQSGSEHIVPQSGDKSLW
ncbi:MAG: hypothetical protein GWP15_00460 [Nitrospirae bacterium]|nr:hypothetical protein [Nitrospirota bacterium]